MNNHAIQTDAKNTPASLSKFRLIGLTDGPTEYPAWMFEDHYQTPCGISISPCGTKTYPVKLNAKQRTAVAKVLQTLS